MEKESKEVVQASARTALTLLIGLFVFRLVYASGLGLAFDESYYWQWSRHLDFAYYDSGPGIALIIRFGTLLFGNTLLGIRFGCVLLGVATGWFSYLTAQRWLGSSKALWSLILLSVAPLFAAGSVLALYDMPQMFCWSVALYYLTRAVQEERPALWYVVGALFGIGMLCKMTMLFFAPSVLMFLLITPAYRKHLSTPHPYLGFLLALVIFSPVILWNAQHEWMNFLHTVGRSNRGGTPQPLRWFGEFWGGQALAIGPFLLLSEVYALWRLSQRRDDGSRFILSFTLPTLILCTLLAFKTRQEINWAVSLHVTGLMVVAVLFAETWTRKSIMPRIGIVAATAVSFVVALVAYYPSLVPLVAGPQPARPTFEKPNETYGWHQLVDPVQSARDEMSKEGSPPLVMGTSYRVSSMLAFYLPDQPETIKLQVPSFRRDQYTIWAKPETWQSRNALVVVDADREKAEAYFKQVFTRVEGPELLTATRPGFTGPIKKWRLYRCYGFHQP